MQLKEQKSNGNGELREEGECCLLNATKCDIVWEVSVSKRAVHLGEHAAKKCEVFEAHSVMSLKTKKKKSFFSFRTHFERC